MKQIKIFLLLALGSVILTACPSGVDDEIISENPELAGKEYNDTYNIPAEGCDNSYTLSMLKSRITSSDIKSNWLTVTILSYTKGSPRIKIVATENQESSERKQIIVLRTENNDKLTLTFVQAGKEVISSGIDDVHNNSSDNPAYSKIYR